MKNANVNKMIDKTLYLEVVDLPLNVDLISGNRLFQEFIQIHTCLITPLSGTLHIGVEPAVFVQQWVQAVGVVIGRHLEVIIVVVDDAYIVADLAGLWVLTEGPLLLTG